MAETWLIARPIGEEEFFKKVFKYMSSLARDNHMSMKDFISSELFNLNVKLSGVFLQA